MRTAVAGAIALSALGCVPAAVSSGGADGAAAASETIPLRLTARGTEPFWAVEVDAGRLVWRTPEQPEGVSAPAQRHVEGGRVRYVSSGAAAFELGVTPGQCSDGMSDLAYPYTATWTHDGRTWHGCALPRE
ncbi:COG3650 family protein [Cognatilysobacter bugurensis]|nr:hypothetical protein [Lysobacter bugurensis]